MKRLILGSLAVVALLAAPLPLAQAYNGNYTPGTGINGTPHDLSAPNQAATMGGAYLPNPADPQQRVCIWCHAPHNTYKLSAANGGPGVGVGAGPDAPDAYTYLPLWNHLPLTNVAFTMYQNGPGAPTDPNSPHASQAIVNGQTVGGTSLLCLSCHDGSLAVNAYGNASQLTTSTSGGGAPIGTQYVIGQDKYLGNHHPVGFDYDAVATVDTEVVSADTAQLGSAGHVRTHLYGVGSTTMECGTCHSVHNKGNTGEALLWRSDTNSRLCLTCHNKGTNPGTTIP